MRYRTTLLAVIAAVGALAFSACGDGDNVGGNGGGGGGGNGGAEGPLDDSGAGDGGESDCLTADEVQEEIDKIASGVEGTDEEVERKQDAIQAVRDRECP